MFGVPVWVWSLAFKILWKLGYFNKAQAIAIKAGMSVIKTVESIEVTASYPTGKNGQRKQVIYSKGPSNGNYNRGVSNGQGGSE